MIRVGAVKFGLTGSRKRKGKTGSGKISPNPGSGGLGMGPKNDKEKNKPGRPGAQAPVPVNTAPQTIYVVSTS